MRVKHIWEYVPLPAKLKLFADRITFSKITIIYFVFSIIHCVIQVAFQVQAFSINASAAKFLNQVIVQGNASEAGFPVLGKDLRWCMSVPNTIDASSCQVVWNGSVANAGNNGAMYLAGQPVAEEAISSIISSSSLPTISVSSQSSLSPLSASVSAPPSVVTSESSAITSAASASTTRTVTATVKVTISNLAQLQSALEAAESSAQAPSITATVTRTVIATATASDEDQHVHRKRETNNPHVISAISVDGEKQVKIGGINGRDEVTLAENCLVALNWPLSRVDDTKREDIVFIGFSIWVLGMSLVAILNESPPHIVASFLTHCLATAWAAFQLFNTQQFHKDFSRLTTNGACGVNLLPNYWTQRANFEIPTLAMNVLGLLISAFLSWKLMKSFGWQTFKRIGASLTMSRAYRSILIFSIVIQLSVFFIVVAVALWVDQVYNGEIARYTSRAKQFEAATITILTLIFPWLAIGWISVRREHRIPMTIFLVLSFLYLVGWSSMFAAPTFKWTFVEWRFFSLMASASAVLALAAFILGIICRCNFGRGLPKYLNTEQSLPGDDFEPATLPYDDEKRSFDEEKVDFPSYETSMPPPTYAELLPPPPAQMSMAPRTLGPRFYASANAIPFERPEVRIDTSVSRPAIPVRLDTSRASLARQGSGSSQHSMLSTSSSNESKVSPFSMRGKRWIIE